MPGALNQRVVATVDRGTAVAEVAGRVVRIPTAARGRHRLELQVSDYQESRNVEKRDRARGPTPRA